MPGISVPRIAIPFKGKGGINYAAYWTTRSLFFLDGTIITVGENKYFEDKSAADRHFLITGYDFATDWTTGFPYKSAATISAPAADAALIAADINNFLYDAGGTPNQIPVISLFQDIDYEHKIFCKHAAQVVDGNGVETYEPRVSQIFMTAAALSLEDLVKANTYFGVPIEVVAAKWVPDDYDNNTAAIAALANGATIYNKTGLFTETSAGTNLDISKKVTISGTGLSKIIHSTGATSEVMMRGDVNFNGVYTDLNNEVNIGLRLYGENNIVDKLYLTNILDGGETIKEGATNSVIRNSIFKIISTRCLSYNGDIEFNTCFIQGIFTIHLIGRVPVLGNKHIFKNCKIKTASTLCYSTISYIDFIGNNVQSDGQMPTFLLGGIKHNILYNTFISATLGATSRLLSAQAGSTAEYNVKNNYFTTTDKAGLFIYLEAGGIVDIENNIVILNKPIVKTDNLTTSVTAKNNRIISLAAIDNDTINALNSTCSTSNIPIIYEQNCILNPRYYHDGFGWHNCIYINTYIDFSIKHNFTAGAGQSNIIIKSGSNVTNTTGHCNYNILYLAGIYIKGQSNVLVYNNTIVDAVISGIILAPGDDLTAIQTCLLRNNVIVNIASATPLLATITSEDESARHDIDYNIYYSAKAKPFSHNGTEKTFAEWQALGYDAHSVFLTEAQANDLFTDYANKDFSLKAGSLAIGAGETQDTAYDDGLDASTDWGSDTAVPVVVTKQQGAAWDCGAYIH